MSPPSDTPLPDPLLDEAIGWLVRLKTGEPTRADVDAFEQWRDQSPAHAAAFRRAAIINRRAGIAAGQFDQSRQLAGLAVSRRLSRRVLLGGGLAAAASIAGYAVVRPPMAMWPSLQELSADYRTSKGERSTVQPVPGVSVELNTLTSLALRSVRDQPAIELVSGEVLVNAQRPPSGSLLMLAAGGQMSASDANFNALCLDGEVSVTCLDGSVDVEHSGQSVRLGKNRQVSYSRAGLAASIDVDPAQVAAWQSGLLIFRDRPLASVVEEVNRYRPGKIVIVSPELRQRSVNGDFEIGKLDSFVAQVQQLFGAHATSLPGGLVLLS